VYHDSKKNWGEIEGLKQFSHRKRGKRRRRLYKERKEMREKKKRDKALKEERDGMIIRYKIVKTLI